jgi:hypothetical protein
MYGTYSEASNDYLTLFGSQFSSGGPTMSYGLASSGSTAWNSTYDNFSGSHSVLVIDGSILRFLGDESNTTTTVGSAVTVYERMALSRTEAVFNEDSRDVDFRVESDTNTHMLFVDGGNNRVLMGTSTSVPAGSPTLVTGGYTAVAKDDVGASPLTSDLLGKSRFTVGGSGGNYLAFGALDNNTTSWIQSAYYIPSVAIYPLVLQPLGGNVGINNSAPATALHVTGNILSTNDLYVGGTVVSTIPALDKAVYLNHPTDNSIIGYNMHISDGGNNRRGSMFLDDSAGIWGWDVTASSGVPYYQWRRAGGEILRLGDDIVFNEPGNDIDFRVESDASTHMLFVDAGTNTVNINTSSPNASAKLGVYSASGINQVNWSINGNPQGSPQFAKVVRYVTSAGSSNTLVIPFLSQSSLNSTTVCRVMGHNAQYNTRSPKSFDFTFGVGHLTLLENLEVWGTGGNYASIAINGMNVEVTFTSAYGATGGEAGGMFITLEYMSNELAYSIQPNSIVLA